ncbi:MAG TPA: hypothetical protein VFU19_11470 [Iamia sp.]|nr:hypothetical protein [Iamia sp.]
MGRSLRTWSAALVALSLLACGGDDDEPVADTTTTSDAETEAADSTTTEAEDTTITAGPVTTSAPATTAAPDADGDLCGALQTVADLTAEVDAIGSADDWGALQDAYADLGPGIVDAYRDAAAAADEETVANDLTLLGDLIEQTVDLVAESDSLNEFGPKVSALPGADEGESAADRLDGYATAECGFALSD